MTADTANEPASDLCPRLEAASTVVELRGEARKVCSVVVEAYWEEFFWRVDEGFKRCKTMRSIIFRSEDLAVG